MITTVFDMTFILNVIIVGVIKYDHSEWVKLGSKVDVITDGSHR